jgi:hypothetical protein
MAKSLGKKAALQLRIMFDTNICWTDSELFLLNKPLSDIILLPTPKDLEIQWILSEVVRLERQYQMATKATAFLRLLRDLERFLDTSLGISQDVLDARTAALIENQIQKHSLRIQHLDITAVDWRRIISDAVNRRPPFEDSETEKGFRDALIVETFAQLVADSDPDPQKCRVILVANDPPLVTAAQLRTSKATNVTIFSKRDELKGFINAMISDIGTQEIDSWNEKASAFLGGTSVRAEAFRRRIELAVSEVLQYQMALPAGYDTYKIQGFRYEDPIFFHQVRRKGARVRNYWSTRINVDLDFWRALASTPPSSSAQTGLFNLGLTGPPAGSYAPGPLPVDGSHSLFQRIITGAASQPSDISSATVFGSPRAGYVTREALKATASFEVEWSAHFSAEGRILRPTVESVGSGEFYFLGV